VTLLWRNPLGGVHNITTHAVKAGWTSSWQLTILPSRDGEGEGLWGVELYVGNVAEVLALALRLITRDERDD
jgi:hypothetical protein